ncbi:hypothetical protein JTE90_013035 [Oedothorax gibbosus]|uniref:Uncharacterized protein n=1 Tax=Oedothorax gibbosus TaxID=931172 RepID=A0AAV6UH08_9ARAC|nr:hypothetical protein JTE90_013035 [Oedothorax gibbosus]
MFLTKYTIPSNTASLFHSILRTTGIPQHTEQKNIFKRILIPTGGIFRIRRLPPPFKRGSSYNGIWGPEATHYSGNILHGGNHHSSSESESEAPCTMGQMRGRPRWGA